MTGQDRLHRSSLSSYLTSGSSPSFVSPGHSLKESFALPFLRSLGNDPVMWEKPVTLASDFAREGLMGSKIGDEMKQNRGVVLPSLRVPCPPLTGTAQSPKMCLISAESASQPCSLTPLFPPEVSLLHLGMSCGLIEDS